MLKKLEGLENLRSSRIDDRLNTKYFTQFPPYLNIPIGAAGNYFFLDAILTDSSGLTIEEQNFSLMTDHQRTDRNS